MIWFKDIFNDYYEMDGCSAPMTFFEWVLEPQRTHELYAYDVT
jgi:hypothetical protein